MRVGVAAAVAASLVFGLADMGFASEGACLLTEEDLTANAKLSFDDFDQKGVTAATARKLGNRQCYAEAARATQHYLVHGPVANHAQQLNLTFHMAQYLASGGDEKTAAWVVASSRNPEDSSTTEFDWNTYVNGTYAFLVKDRPLLESMTKLLSSKSGVGNSINSRVLQGLLKCYDRPYAEAYGDDCRPAKK